MLIVQQNVVHLAIPYSSRAPYSLGAPFFKTSSQAPATIWKFGLPSLLKYLGFESNLSSNFLGLFSSKVG
jgi:hypothetical protein